MINKVSTVQTGVWSSDQHGICYVNIFININFPVKMKTNCVTWLIKTKSQSKLQRTQFGNLENSNNLFFMQDRHLHTGLQICATGWTKISQSDGLEEEVHRTATPPGLLKWTNLCGDASKLKCMSSSTKLLVTSKPQ